MKDTENDYGCVTRYMHWIVGLILIGNYAFGWYLNPENVPKFQWNIYNVHESIGLIIFVLILFRIYWRIINPLPKLPEAIPMWQKKASRINIYLMYLLVFLMPVSGVLMALLGNYSLDLFGGLIKIPAIADIKTVSKFFVLMHEVVAWALGACFALHFGAAMYHHFIIKDDVLRKMLNFK